MLRDQPRCGRPVVADQRAGRPSVLVDDLRQPLGAGLVLPLLDRPAWEFSGEVRLTRFFDEGNLVRIQVQIRESGTVSNQATGEVVELPRTAFMERVLLIEDGSIIIEDVGLSVRVTGPDDLLLDVGRFVVHLNPNELLQSSGQHPIREINPFSVSDPALLGAFCDLFA
jgi:hypothetical protein